MIEINKHKADTKDIEKVSLKNIKETKDTPKKSASSEKLFKFDDFDLDNFIAKETTSPTIIREKDGFIEDDTTEVLGGVKDEDEVVVIKEDKEEVKDDKTALTKEEIAFFVELILEGVDWLFDAGMKLADRQVTKTTAAQKQRIIDAVSRIADKHEFKLTPELSLFILFGITYGVKAIRSKEIKKVEKETKKDVVKEDNKTVIKMVKKESFNEDEKIDEYKQDRGLIN